MADINFGDLKKQKSSKKVSSYTLITFFIHSFAQQLTHLKRTAKELDNKAFIVAYDKKTK